MPLSSRRPRPRSCVMYASVFGVVLFAQSISSVRVPPEVILIAGAANSAAPAIRITSGGTRTEEILWAKRTTPNTEAYMTQLLGRGRRDERGMERQSPGQVFYPVLRTGTAVR